jgi:hypothetical protein
VDTLTVVRRIVAAAFLVGFVGVWAWIAVKLFRFEPTQEMPRLVLSSAFATVSGALSGTVGAGTAAVLGIKVQQLKQGGSSFTQSLAGSANAAPLLIAGVLAYLAAGALMIVAWLTNDAVAPDAVQSFAIGALGWMGGAFVSVFATAEG